MKRPLLLVLLIAIGAAMFTGRAREADAPAPGGPARTPATSTEAGTRAGLDSLQRAIAARAEEVPVTGGGKVVKLLADDREGSRHQRILVRVEGGGTVLIAHNIDLSPRVSPLEVGDQLEFAGDYVWNEKGGVVHWTHPDPQGRHRAGWVRRVDRQ